MSAESSAEPCITETGHSLTDGRTSDTRAAGQGIASNGHHIGRLGRFSAFIAWVPSMWSRSSSDLRRSAGIRVFIGIAYADLPARHNHQDPGASVN